MGRCYDPSGRVGSGCRPGMQRLRAWARREFGGGDLGCFNPASRAGSGPSLHADGRADDIAFDATTHEGYAAGRRFFLWIIAHHNELGLQETLFAGDLWSCQNAHLGIRGPNIQRAAHMNHVHWGVTYEAADHWEESWLTETPGTPAPPAPRSHTKEILLMATTGIMPGVWLPDGAFLTVGVGTDRQLYAQLSDPKTGDSGWVSLGGRCWSNPELTQSPDGRTVVIQFLGDAGGKSAPALDPPDFNNFRVPFRVVYVHGTKKFRSRFEAARNLGGRIEPAFPPGL